jgi:hypothetical protein
MMSRPSPRRRKPMVSRIGRSAPTRLSLAIRAASRRQTYGHSRHRMAAEPAGPAGSEQHCHGRKRARDPSEAQARHALPHRLAGAPGPCDRPDDPGSSGRRTPAPPGDGHGLARRRLPPATQTRPPLPWP